jgi:hypothetical protein
MQWRRFVLGLAVGFCCVPAAARAILIETGGVQVGGYFHSDDGKTLTIKVRSADGTEKIKEYERGKIKIIHQLDRNRLENLSSDVPKGYRDYAEELALQKNDPEAKDMAMRLLLIAAYLDPKQFGHSSLLRMSAIASTPLEARKCRAMAFLLDPTAAARLPKTDEVKPPPPAIAQAAALKEFGKALQYYRAGQIDAAKKSARFDGMDKIFTMAPGMIDQKTFLQKCTDATCTTCKSKGKLKCTVCNGKKVTRNTFGQVVPCTTCNGSGIVFCTACDGTGMNPISDEVLRIVIRAELWAVDQLAGAPRGKKGTADTTWSVILEARQANPVLPLSLETITEFDPRKCLYRNGAWTAP